MKYVISRTFDLSPLAQIAKLPMYLFTYAFSVVLYRFVLEDSKPLKALKKSDLSFNSMIIAIVCFFVFALVYLNLTVVS